MNTALFGSQIEHHERPSTLNVLQENEAKDRNAVRTWRIYISYHDATQARLQNPSLERDWNNAIYSRNELLDEFEAFNPVKPELKLLVAIFSETESKHSAIN